MDTLLPVVKGAKPRTLNEVPPPPLPGTIPISSSVADSELDHFFRRTSRDDSDSSTR